MKTETTLMDDDIIRLKKSYCLEDPDAPVIWNYAKSKCDGGYAVSSYDEGIEMLKDFASKTEHSPAFALLMERDGELRVFERPNQPCIGGELRKYHESHGDLYTNPQPCNDGEMDVYRPGDLRYPFPLGTPRALVYCLGGFQPMSQDVIDVVMHDDNPYRDACRGLSFLTDGKREIYRHGIGIIPGWTGLLFEDLNVQSTVLVNFIQTHYLWTSPNSPVAFRNLGLSPMRSWAAALMYTGKVEGGIQTSYNRFAGAWFSAKLSPQTLIKKPKDITGGTFADRYDYNRNKIHTLFSGTWRPTFEKQIVPEEEFVSRFNDKCDEVGLR